MDRISRYNLARHLEKRKLLIAVNSVAALSIFYFGYDQGVMGGVNNNRSFAETMGFGHFSEAQNQVVVTKSALKGGIVSSFFPWFLECFTCCQIVKSPDASPFELWSDLNESRL